jgi:AcrR family transcriptional regulator
MVKKIDSGRIGASPHRTVLEPATKRKKGIGIARANDEKPAAKTIHRVSKSARPPMPRTRRTRRSAPEAKRQILDAAEAQLAQFGPGGLRLQSVAAEIGLSHPVILHHFGSREGLIDALNARTVEQLKSSMATLLAGATAPNRNLVETTLEHVFNTFGNGLAQRLAWLATSSSSGETSIHDALTEIARLVQLARVVYASQRGTPPPPFEDSRRIALLIATSAMGAAIFGVSMITSPKDAGYTEHVIPFRTWLSKLIVNYLGQFPSGMTSSADPLEQRRTDARRDLQARRHLKIDAE